MHDRSRTESWKPGRARYRAPTPASRPDPRCGRWWRMR